MNNQGKRPLDRSVLWKNYWISSTHCSFLIACKCCLCKYLSNLFWKSLSSSVFHTIIFLCVKDFRYRILPPQEGTLGSQCLCQSLEQALQWCLKPGFYCYHPADGHFWVHVQLLMEDTKLYQTACVKSLQHCEWITFFVIISRVQISPWHIQKFTSV